MNNSHTVSSSLTTISAINEEALDKLVVEIYDYAGKIKSILDSVEDIILGTEPYFNCEIGETTRNKFKMLSSKFTAVSDNVISYAEDLVQVKTSYYKISDDLSQIANISKKEVLSNKITTYQEKR